MKRAKRLVCAALFTVCWLFFTGCADTVEETVEPTAPNADTAQQAGFETFPMRSDGETVALIAAFQWEDGSAAAGSVQLTAGTVSATYRLSAAGELRVNGLPCDGMVELLLLDAAAQELGRTTICISTGAVVDAFTDVDGTGYLTVREDTDAVTLQFTVRSGVLMCALRLR